MSLAADFTDSERRGPGEPDRTAPLERTAADRRFERIALALFTVWVAVLSALHEPWKDETQTWRLAIDSDGIRALIHNARYEGHPLLFHLMLQALGHLSRSWWAAAAMHAVIACAAAWVVLRYAPFTRLQKALVIAGYFPAYEYAVIVRPYGLGMLFAFGACAAWTAPRRRPVWTVVFLILLANTSVLGVQLALAAGAAFFLDSVWPDDAPPRISLRTLGAVALCAALALVVVWLVARQVIPPTDARFKGSGGVTQGMNVWKFATGLLVPFRAMVPIDKIGEGTTQWGRWLFDAYVRSALIVDVLVSSAIVVVGCIIASRRRTALLFFLMCTVGLIAFFELFVEGSARHHGHFAIAWIMAAWLSRAGPPTVWPGPIRAIVDRAQRYAPRLFTLSLVPMVLGAAELGVSDALLPFSDAGRTADFLRTRGLADAPIIGVSRADAQTIAALLDRPIIMLSEGRSSTFVVWGAAPKEASTQTRMDAVTDSLFRQSCRAVLISIRPHELPSTLQSRASLIYETSYRPISRDRFRVWLMPAPVSPRCPATPAATPAAAP